MVLARVMLIHVDYRELLSGFVNIPMGHTYQFEFY